MEKKDYSVEDIKLHLRKHIHEMEADLATVDARRVVLLREITAHKNSLAALEGKDMPEFPSVLGVMGNQFRNKRLADAIEEYMETLESQKGEGKKVSLDELTAALKQGGADLGTQEWREKTVVRISVSKNPKMFNITEDGYVSLKKKRDEGK